MMILMTVMVDGDDSCDDAKSKDDVDDNDHTRDDAR